MRQVIDFWEGWAQPDTVRTDRIQWLRERGRRPKIHKRQVSAERLTFQVSVLVADDAEVGK